MDMSVGTSPSRVEAPSGERNLALAMMAISTAAFILLAPFAPASRRAATIRTVKNGEIRICAAPPVLCNARRSFWLPGAI
jgi:hypothetical protein